MSEEKKSAIYQAYFCTNCEHFELPAEMQGKDHVPKPEVCPECGSDEIFKKKGRFIYRTERRFPFFKKEYALSRFEPLKDQKPSKKAKKAGAK